MVLLWKLKFIQTKDSCKVNSRFTYQAYNFYIFPHSNLKGFPNVTFQCQSSSLTFLSNCGFDFNKAFGEGTVHLVYLI